MKVLAWFGFIIITLQIIKQIADTVRGETPSERAGTIVAIAITIPAELFFILYLF